MFVDSNEDSAWFMGKTPHSLRVNDNDHLDRPNHVDAK
jgi:hypothetical protein